MAVSSRRAALLLEQAIVRAIDTLEWERDPLLRARVAHELAERMRLAQEEFGDQRTAAFWQLRDEGWSLADMKEEFGIARARAAQIINRDSYKDAKRAKKKGTR
jgi:hypothetical protein